MLKASFDRCCRAGVLLFWITAASLSRGAGSAVEFDTQNDGLRVPDGFQVAVVAEVLGRARHLAVRDNGDIYVAMRESHANKCLAALRDTDGDAVADLIHYFGDYGECGSVEIHRGYLYFSNLKTVYRVPLKEGELVPSGEVEVVAKDFAANGQWHNYKVLAFDESGNVYVNVGSPSNVCQTVSRKPGSPGLAPCPQLAGRAGIWRFRADENNQRQAGDGHRYATGIRNGVALAWNPLSKALYTIPHGRDLLHDLWPGFYSSQDSAELPAEEFFRLHDGFNGGWPYAYYDQRRQQKMVSPEYGGRGDTPETSAKYGDPVYAFPGHWGPNDLIFYTGSQFPQHYFGGAFVAFVGGWNRAPYPQQGYKVMFVPFNESGDPGGDAMVFADNFAKTAEVYSPDDAQHRPTGLAQGPDGSLYISDSNTGRIWRVFYTGKSLPGGNRSSAARVEARQPAAANGPQDKAYMAHCAACHMANGSGVSRYQPALRGSALVAGPERELVELVLKGKNSDDYANSMPAFAHLDDETLARILSYIRGGFGNSAEAISADDVRGYR
ncbi:MAG: PQQ-dependent sugar dehydrogenase [Haliea sp.]|uniref:c-type cytochrome n=1 Tax=Marinobacter salarius TaxID=1420917 RepID=UPI0032EEE456